MRLIDVGRPGEGPDAERDRQSIDRLRGRAIREVVASKRRRVEGQKKITVAT